MIRSNKKELIVNATLCVVSKNGLTSSPVAKVAEEAGVSVGLIYRYFKNKDELIALIYQDILNELDLNFSEKLSDKSIKKQVKKRWQAAFDFLLENPLKADYLREFRVLNRVLENEQNLYEIENFFSKSRVKAEIKGFTLKVVVELLISSLLSAYSLAKSGEMMDKSLIADNVYSYFWDGISL